MNKIDFNVYDMVVIEDENGSIYQECIKEIRNISDHYPTIQQIICNEFIIDCDMKGNEFEYTPFCMICNKGRDKKKYILLEVWQQKEKYVVNDIDIVKTKVYMRTYDNYLHLTNEQMKMTPAEMLGIVDKKEEVNLSEEDELKQIQTNFQGKLSEEDKKRIEDATKKIIEEYNQKDIDLTNECCDCENVKVENNTTKD